MSGGDKIDAGRVIGLGLTGALWKKHHIITLVQYNDNISTEPQLIAFDLGDGIQKVQPLIYDKMQKAKKDAAAEVSEEKVICPKCQTEGKKSKVILYPGQTIPKLKYTDGYWNENGDFVEFNAEIKLPWYICSNGHLTPRRVEDR